MFSSYSERLPRFMMKAKAYMAKRRLAALVVLTCAGFVTSCIVVPLPSVNPNPVLAGKSPNLEDLNAIFPSWTTREEVIAKLGEPTIDLLGFKMLVYPWVSLKRTWLTIIATPQGLGAIPLPQTDSTALFIAIDDDGRVEKFGFLEQLTVDRFSIVNQARRWAVANEVYLPARRNGYVPGAIPLQSGSITIHRATPPNAALGFFTRARFVESVAISMDGKFVAELLDDEYVSLPVSSGTHVIGVNPAPPYRYWPDHPGASSISAIHPASLTVSVADGSRLFVHLEATLGAGLTFDTIMKLQTEIDAEHQMANSLSIW